MSSESWYVVGSRTFTFRPNYCRGEFELALKNNSAHFIVCVQLKLYYDISKYLYIHLSLYVSSVFNYYTKFV